MFKYVSESVEVYNFTAPNVHRHIIVNEINLK